MKVLCRQNKLRQVVKRFGSSRRNRVHQDALWLVSVFYMSLISARGKTTLAEANAWFPSSRNARSVRSVKTVPLPSTYGTDGTDGTDGTVFCRAVTTERWKPFSVAVVNIGDMAVTVPFFLCGYSLCNIYFQSGKEDNIFKHNMSRKQTTNEYNQGRQSRGRGGLGLGPSNILCRFLPGTG